MSTLTGTGTLLRAALRRERARLLGWAVALGALTLGGARGLATTYPSAADRQARGAVMTNPAAVFFSGPGYGIHHYTPGAMVANELQLTLAVAACVMSIQLLVRTTRAEEEDGRAELVRPGAIGRRAVLAVGLAVVALADAAVGLAVAAALLAGGFATADSLGLAAGVAATGLVFGALAAVSAQLSERARVASGTTLALLGIAAVVRGVGDARHRGGSALSWASPIAWAQQMRPFVALRWEPLLPSILLVTLAVLVADQLGVRRDLGAGLRRARAGRAHASRWLGGPAALTARLERGQVIAWSSAVVVLGAVFGALADAVTTMIAGNARLAAVLGGTAAGARDAFLALAAFYLAATTAAYGIAAVQRLRAQEAAGHTAVLLSAPVSRVRLVTGQLAVIAAACAGMLLAGGTATGAAAAATSGRAALLPRVVEASLVPLPAVLVVVGVAAVLVAAAPRAAALAWVLYAWTLLVGLLGSVIGMPEWARHVSPFAWVPRVPAAAPDARPLAALLALACLLAALAVAAYRRRDVAG